MHHLTTYNLTPLFYQNWNFSASLVKMFMYQLLCLFWSNIPSIGQSHFRVIVRLEMGSGFEGAFTLGSTNVRVRLDDVNAVHLKRVVWGTVHVNSATVRCWYERICTKPCKWTAINVLFDINVCLCVFRSLSWRVRPTGCKQRAVSHFCLPSAFFRAFAILSNDQVLLCTKALETNQWFKNINI